MTFLNQIQKLLNGIVPFLPQDPVRYSLIYSFLVLADLVVLRVYGLWHLIVLGFILTLLISQTLIIKQRYIAISSSLYIFITICIASYDLGGLPQTDNELSIVQYFRIIESFVVLSAIYSMYKYLGIKLQLGTRRLILIFTIPLLFILFLFDIFSFQLQMVLIVRISQIAIISSYVLCVRKPIHWGFSIWVLCLTLLGVTGALRLSGIFDERSLIAEDMFELFSFLFFVLGLNLTLLRAENSLQFQKSNSRRNSFLY